MMDRAGLDLWSYVDRAAARAVEREGTRLFVGQVTAVDGQRRVQIRRPWNSAPDGPYYPRLSTYQPQVGDWVVCLETVGGVIVLGQQALSGEWLDRNTWGLAARLQGLIIIPEGRVYDSNGAVTLTSTVIVMNPASGSYFRVAAGTYNLGAWGALVVDMPPTSARGTVVTPQVVAWSDADRLYDGRDRLVLAQRLSGGPVFYNFAVPSRAITGPVGAIRRLVGTVTVGSNVDTPVSWDTTVYDSGGSIPNSTRITAREPGIYAVAWSFVYNGGGAVAERYAAVVVNGATGNRIAASNQWTDQTAALSGAGILTLNAGDYVELWAFQSSGASLIARDSLDENWLALLKVGAT